MDSLLFRGGTILGTSNRGRFSAKVGHGEVRRVAGEVLGEAYDNFQQLGLKALVCIGGDGSLTIAQQLYEIGMPVVGIPKTIDNDLDATIMTFGFETAVSCAVDALDRLHTTAESHDRMMVLEVMGRYAGWIAASAGLAGGADVILIPEIPFTYDSIIARIQEREEYGKRITIIIVAEGAREKDGDYVASEAGKRAGEARLGGIGHVVAGEIQKRTGKETRAVVLGHLQRGGRCPYCLGSPSLHPLWCECSRTDCGTKIWGDGSPDTIRYRANGAGRCGGQNTHDFTIRGNRARWACVGDQLWRWVGPTSISSDPPDTGNNLLNSGKRARIGWVTPTEPGQIDRSAYIECISIRRNAAVELHTNVEPAHVETGIDGQLTRIAHQGSAAG